MFKFFQIKSLEKETFVIPIFYAKARDRKNSQFNFLLLNCKKIHQKSILFQIGYNLIAEKNYDIPCGFSDCHWKCNFTMFFYLWKKEKTFQIYFDKIYCIHPIKYSKNNNNIIFIIMPIMQASYIPRILSWLCSYVVILFFSHVRLSLFAFSNKILSSCVWFRNSHYVAFYRLKYIIIVIWMT